MLKNIAFFVDNIEENYFKILTNAIDKAATTHNVNLIIVLGGALNSTKDDQLIYDLITNKNVDGIIMSSGSLSKNATADYLQDFISKWNIPIVSLSIPVYGTTMIGIDNNTGIREIINHLVTKHNRKKICFIAGPKDHFESELRFNAYVQALEENNLPFDQDLIFYGNFIEQSGIDMVNHLISKNIEFDSIVSANDEMALGAINALKHHKISVPEQVSVTGFDNISTSILSEPALTTVIQPINIIGNKAVEVLLQKISGQINDEDIIFNDTVIYRESCGCQKHSCGEIDNFNIDCFVDSFVANHKNLIPEKYVDKFAEIHKDLLCILYLKNKETDIIQRLTELIEDLNEDEFFGFYNLMISFMNNLPEFVLIEIGRYIFELFLSFMNRMQKNNIKQTRHMWHFMNELQEIKIKLSSTLNVRDQIIYLYEKLYKLGITNCQIMTYENVIKEYAIPKEIIFHKVQGNIVNQITLPIDDIFTMLPERQTMVLLPLSFNNIHRGIIMMNYNNKYDNTIYRVISTELLCSIELTHLMLIKNLSEKSMKNSIIELETKNNHLNTLSITDELTGLYNRRGFIELSEKYTKLGYRHNKKFVLIFADMNGLKKINDTYGHDEGDSAIQNMAKILKQSVRETDIIARFGGDEFAITTIVDDSFHEQIIRDRINKLCETYNQQSDKPYKISISLGFSSVSEDKNLSDTLALADELMYIEKKNIKK